MKSFAGSLRRTPPEKFGFSEINDQLRARDYKTFFMLISTDHEILNAHEYKNINKFSFFQPQISRECYFSCS